MKRCLSLILLVASVLFACGGKKPALSVEAPSPVKPATFVVTAPASHHITTVVDKTIGPFMARRDDGAIAVYVEVAPAGGRRVVSVPLGIHGEPTSPSRVIETAPVETNSLIVRKLGGKGGAFLAAWTSLTDRGQVLRYVGIGTNGVARSESIEAARSMDDIVWTEMVATDRGGILLWAEETRAGDVNILSMALEPDGRPRGVPSNVAKGVAGWQATATTNGAALALVIPGRDKRAKFGTLTWLRMDVEGRPLGSSVVSNKPTVSGDVDVVHAGKNYLFAWTDRTGFDPTVMLTSVDEQGATVAPPTAPLGGSVLVGLTSSPHGAVVAWDQTEKKNGRQVNLAKVDDKAAVDFTQVVTVDAEHKTTLELASRGDDVALIGTMRACALGESGMSSAKADTDACTSAPFAPMFLRLDSTLHGMQVDEPLLSDLKPVPLMWGLDCSAGSCLALGASEETPTRVFSFEFVPRPSIVRPPLVALDTSGVARVVTSSTIASGPDAFADLAVASVGENTMLALLTSAVDDPSQTRRGPGSGATLSVRVLDLRGAPIGSPTLLTTRALNVGGVAMAAGVLPKDGAAIAWVARDGGDPQVHVTRVDPTGKKLNDLLLTTTRGDASDVAITWSKDGWLVAWVDGRDGNGEVYAVKLSADLQKSSMQNRITNAPGDASDVSLIADGDNVWIAWADPRESPKDGAADIYVTSLRTKDARKKSDEVRVLASAAHSRSPVLAMSSSGPVVGWIEEAPMNTQPGNMAAYGAMVAWLDSNGKAARSPIRVQGAADGIPTSFVFESMPYKLVRDGVRGIVARSTRDELALDAAVIRSTGEVKTSPIWKLDGPPSLDVALGLLADGAVYYQDEGPTPSDHRAKRVELRWLAK